MFSKPDVLFMPVWNGVSRVWKIVKPEDEKEHFCFYDLLQTEADYVFCPFETAMKNIRRSFLITAKFIVEFLNSAIRLRQRECAKGFI